MNNICIIIPFYGKWPPYLNLFLSGVRSNSHIIDIHFFTDLNLDSYDISENIFIHDFSFERIKILFEEKIGCPINLTNPYKLCDLKPTYGFVFSEFIAKYNFWGFGDIDLVYGNLESYLNKSRLDQFNVISGREKWLSGCLSILKNERKTTTLFFKSSDYQNIFNTEEYLGFDEISKCWEEIKAVDSIIKINLPYDNFTLLLYKEKLAGQLTMFSKNVFKESINNKGYLKIKDDNIFDEKNKEYPVYHFITEKRKWYFQFPKWDKVPSEFFIDSNCFYRGNQFYNLWHKRMFIFFFRILNLHKWFDQAIKRIINKISFLKYN